MTSIGGSAFSGCSGLTSVTIPSSVASIGDAAFGGCSGLTSVTIPNSVTSIGGSAFRDCSGLTSVTIDRTQPLSIGSNTFSNRANATLYVPAGSKEAYEAADYWKEFKEIKDNSIIDFADANVKALCVENWDTNEDGELSEAEAAAVTELGEVFKENEDITSFDELQYFTGLTSIGENAFRNCINMTSVTIPSSVTSIGDRAFSECKKLSSMEIPDQVTTIGLYAFSGLTSNQSLHIGRSLSSVYGCSFANNAALTSITVDEENATYDSRNNCNAVIETATNKLIVGCQTTVIPEDVTTIGNNAFWGRWSMASIEIPANITVIEPNAFSWCISLRTVDARMETPCTLEENTFDNIPEDCVLYVPAGTKAAYIAKGWTEDVFKEIKDNSIIDFADANVKALCVENWDTDGDGELCKAEAAVVTELGEVFKGNTDITSFDELQYFTGLTSIGENAFNGCENLTSIVIPNTVTTIGVAAFNDTGLENFTVPGTVKTVDWGAFTWNTSLKRVVYEEGVQNVGNIQFYGCTSLEEVVFPSTLTARKMLGMFNFGGTNKLTHVVMPVWPQTRHAEFFGNNDDVAHSVLFDIPASTAQAYLQMGYYNISDNSALDWMREEFETEATNVEALKTAEGITASNEAKETLQNAVTAARTAVQQAGSYLAIGEQMDAVKSAAKTFLGSATIAAGTDVTAIIRNPQFNNMDFGWSINSNTYYDGCTVGYQNTEGFNEHTNGEVSIHDFVEVWLNGAPLGDGQITQTLTNLPAGVYRLEVDAIASWQHDANVEVTGVNLFAGTKNTPIATADEKPEHFTVDFTQDVTGDCTIGIDFSDTNANWVAMDNIRLLYLGEASLPHVDDEEDNRLILDDAEVCKGRQITLPVNMNNTESIKGIQFEMTLPAGVSVATDADDVMMFTLTSRAHSSHAVSATRLSNGDYRVVVSSLSARTFSGTEGDIMNITLNVADNVQEGEYEVKVHSIVLNTAENVSVEPADATATLTVKDIAPGDVNGDVKINVTDVGMVIDDILENTPANFVKAAADLNGDGKVNVTDVGLIIDIILSDDEPAGARKLEKEVDVDTLDPQ